MILRALVKYPSVEGRGAHYEIPIAFRKKRRVSTLSVYERRRRRRRLKVAVIGERARARVESFSI